MKTSGMIKVDANEFDPVETRDSDHDDYQFQVFYPDAPGTYKVIVYSHGNGGTPEGSVTELAKAWTDAGYIVIAPVHLDSSLSLDKPHESSPGVPDQEANWRARADDLSIALNIATEFHDNPSVAIPGMPPGYAIDLNDPVLAGHSFGANTVALVAGATATIDTTGLEDTRFHSAIALAGSGGNASGTPFTPDSFDSIDIAFLRLSGAFDFSGETIDPGDRIDGVLRKLSDADTYAVWDGTASHRSLTKAEADDYNLDPDPAASFDRSKDMTLLFLDGYAGGNLDARIELRSNAVYGGTGGQVGTDAGETKSGSTTQDIDDLYFARGGDDVIYGRGGNDQLFGMAGNDTLSGGNGNDILNGGEGDDTMTGGDGDDTYIVDADDTVIEAAGKGNDTVFAYRSYTLPDNVEKLQLAQSQGGNVFTGTGNALANTLRGTNRTEILVGLGGDDFLDGGEGDDVLIGGSGADTLDGNSADHDNKNHEINNASYRDETVSLTIRAGNTSLSTGSAQGDIYYDIQMIEGGSGNDIIYGNDKVTMLEGGGGEDDLIGDGTTVTTATYRDAAGRVEASLLTGVGTFGDANGDDFSHIQNLEGSAYDDILAGDDSANTLSGRDGNDTLTGNKGNDTLVGGGGADHLDGGNGIDRASYRYATAGVTASLLTGSGTGGEADGDSFVSIEQMEGSNYDDILIASNNGNVLIGLGGNDQLIGGAGADTLVGVGGSNILSGGGGNDTLNGGVGDDVLIGGAGEDILDGNSTGTANPDLEFNTASYRDETTALTISAINTDLSSGSAYRDAYLDIQMIEGGSGNDTIYGSATVTMIEGGAGEDHLIGAGGTTISTASYRDANGRVEASLASGGIFGDADGDNFTAIENLEGSAYDDVLTGDANTNMLMGGEGADTLDGGGGTDTASYRYATAGVSASLFTDSGTAGEAAGDVYTSIEQLQGSLFTDTLEGDGLANRLEGLDGDDALSGRGGIDTLLGGEGSDYLDGGTGADTLNGQNGEDVLIGGVGADILIGGDGDQDGDGIEAIDGYTDAFRYTATSESTVANADQIQLFDPTLDLIDVAAIDARTDVSGMQGFSSIVSGAFGASGQIRVRDTGNDCVLEFNTDSNLNTVEMQITLVGIADAGEISLDNFLSYSEGASLRSATGGQSASGNAIIEDGFTSLALPDHARSSALYAGGRSNGMGRMAIADLLHQSAPI